MGLFGIFGRTRKLGTMALDHGDNGDVYLQTDLQPSQLLMAFPLYLDRLAFDIGGHAGNALWQALFLRASEARMATSDHPQGVPLEQLKYTPQLGARVTGSPPGGNSVLEVATLVEKSNTYMITLETIPPTAPNPEPRLAAGCEALFVHLFNTLPQQEKFFLPIIVIGQCNWYQNNGGLPSMMQLTAAPSYGMALVQQLAASGR